MSDSSTYRNIFYVPKKNNSFPFISTSLKGLVILFLLATVGLRIDAQPCTTPVIDLGPAVTQCGGTVTLDAGNAGATYQWSDNSTSEFFVVDTTGDYSVTVTNAPNCSSNATIHVTINPVPTVTLTDVTQCGGKVVLDAGNAGASLIDQSQPNTGAEISAFYQTDIAQSFIPSIGSISGASIILYLDGTGPGDITISLYTDLPSNSGTLIASGTADNRFPGDTAVVSWSPVFVTPGNTYYLVLTSSNDNMFLNGSIANPYTNGIVFANPGYTPFPADDYAFSTYSATSYYWSDGSNQQKLDVSTSGTYSVTVTNAYNCSASATANVYIKPTPVVNLGPDITQCGGSVTLDAGNPGDTYHWYNNATSQTIIVSSTGTYSVTVTDTASNCTASDIISVTTNPIPVVNLGFDVATCNTSYTLDAGNAGSTYKWGTGATTETITVTNSGYYVVTVTNGTNCSAANGVNIDLLQHPQLGADKTISTCPFTTVDLTTVFVSQGYSMLYSSPTPNAVGPGTYTAIAFGTNGCTDTALITVTNKVAPNLGADINDSICPFTTADLTTLFATGGLTMDYGTPLPKVAPPGFYTVIATNQNGCRDTALVNVTYRQKPDLGEDKADSICAGYTYDLTSLYSNNGYSGYVWNTPFPSAVTAGTYTLVVTNASGCTDTAVATITPRQQPVVTFSMSPNICITVPAFTLTGGSPVGGTYRVDSLVLSTFDPVALGIGPHQVTYIFTNGSGCTDSATEQVTVRQQPFITTLLAPDICTTTIPLDLNDYFTPKNGVYSGIGISEHYFYPVITPSGQDTITDIYTDQYGCVDTSIYPVTVHPSVHTILTSSVAEFSICVGQSVTFYAKGAEQYQFLINGQSQGAASATDSFTTNTLQNHDEITVVGSNACSSDTAGPLIYDVHALPVVNAGTDTAIALGTTIQLIGSATGNGVLVYQWLPGKGLNYTTILNPTYSGSDSVTFTLYASDIYGCIDSDQVTIGVYIPDEIALPNFITPNGDGLNDVWKINPKLDLNGSSLVVFNRWGEQVYSAENYASNWDGTFKGTGKHLPDGTYYYVFKVPSQNNHTYRGAINILNADK